MKNRETDESFKAWIKENHPIIHDVVLEIARKFLNEAVSVRALRYLFYCSDIQDYRYFTLEVKELVEQKLLELLKGEFDISFTPIFF